MSARRVSVLTACANRGPGLTEERISEIFSSVGRVVSFRLVYDRETGRPKGFGFAEYLDPETAASAVRNLNNHEVQGRKLKVDFSHEGNAQEMDNYYEAGAQAGGMMGGGMGAGAPQQQGRGGLPPLPPGVQLPPNVSAPDAISRTLQTLPSQQLFDIIVQMKQLVTTDPGKAVELLRQAPQLSYAVFQALLLMNIVDTSILTQVIETNQPAAPPPPPVAPTPVQAPPVVAPPIPQNPYGMPQPAAVPTYPTPQPAAPVETDPQRLALIQQVLSLTAEQIAALPPDQQQIISMLKARLMAGQAI